MSKVYADTVEASDDQSNLVLGATGDSVTVGGTSINANIVQDSGGNVLFQSDGTGTLSNVNSGFANNLHLLTTQTITSEVSSVDFTTKIDSTYDAYVFQIINAWPSEDTRYLQFAASTVGGSGWANNIVGSFWAVSKAESGSSNAPSYQSDRDTPNTTPCKISSEMGNDSDEAGTITLNLFSPSSTTFAKVFYTESQILQSSSYSNQDFVAGYINTSDAVNAIKFYYTSGNVGQGIFKLYGIL